MDRENFSEGLKLEEFNLDMTSLCQSPNYFLGNNVNFNQVCMLLNNEYGPIKFFLNKKLIL